MIKSIPSIVKDYFETHDLDPIKTNELFGVTWTENTIEMPVHDTSGKYIFTKIRNLDPEKPKYLNGSGSHATLYNYHRVKDEAEIIYCEGEIDCQNLYQKGIASVTSTGGAGTFLSDWVQLLENKILYICLDTDRAGIEGIKKIIDLFPNAKIIELPDSVKDVSEYFASGHTKNDFLQLKYNSISTEEWKIKHQPEEYNILSTRDILSKDIPESPWLIKNILHSEGFCFIFGAEGTGKSLVALDIAKSLAMGKNWLDMEQFEITSKHNVLVLDKENSLQIIRKRLKGLGYDSMNDDRVFFLEYPERFTFSDGKGEYSEFAKSITEKIKRNNIEVIIFDSFVDFIVGNESSTVDTQDFFDSIRELYPRIAYLALHHENKPSQGVFRNDSQRMRGSSNLAAQVVTAFRLEASDNQLYLKQVKARDSKKLERFCINMLIKELGRGETVVTGFEYVGNATKVTDANKSSEIRLLIEELVKTYKTVSRKQIMELGISKGISEGTIRNVIRDMVADGSINEFKKGKEKYYTLGLFSKNIEKENIDPIEIFDGELPSL